MFTDHWVKIGICGLNYHPSDPFLFLGFFQRSLFLVWKFYFFIILVLNGSLSHFMHQYISGLVAIPIIENPYGHAWHLCFGVHLINSSRPIYILWVRIVLWQLYIWIYARVYLYKHFITQLFVCMPTWLWLFIYCCVDTSIDQLTKFNIKVTYVSGSWPTRTKQKCHSIFQWISK